MNLVVPYKTPTGAGSGDMLKANNLGDVVSVASARANLDVMSRGDCLGRDISQGAGGILFDGKTSASCRIYALLGAAGSIGSGEFSLWVRLRAPQAAASGNPLLVWVGPDNTIMGSAGTFSLYYGTGNHLYARLFTAGGSPNDEIVRTLTNLRSTYEGQVIDLVFVRDASGLTVYVNGSVWSAYSDSATGTGAWSKTVTSTYLCLGPAASTAGTQPYYRCVLLNLALTASEVSEITTIGIPFRMKWGSAVECITSTENRNFDGGTVGNWTADSPASVSNPDTKLRLTLASSGSSTARLSRSYASSPPVGRTYRIKADLWRGTTACTSWYLQIGGGCVVVTNLSQSQTTVTGLITTTSTGDLVIYNTSGSDGGTLYVDNVSLVAAGAVCDLDLAVGAGPQIPDRGGNKLHAASATWDNYGWEHKTNRRHGEFMVVRTLAHSDISATAGTTTLFSLPANCGVLEAEFDRETAFDSGTTLDIGISGASGKYVSGASVAATGKLLAESSSKVSESASAATTVYIKKNQATTQGSTTVRARCVIRG